MSRTAIGVILLALVLGALIAGVSPSRAQSSVTGALSGPDALAPGGTGTYFLNASGGPAAESNGNFSIRFWISGPDLTGGLPNPSAPESRAGNASGRFVFNVTAPQKEQAISLVVEINSTAGSRFEKGTVTKAVTVITPIVLSATFRNGGASAAVDVRVRFFVDGRAVGTTTMARIEPGGTGTAALTWLPVGLGQGAHSVRVEADLNKNGVIEQDKGEVVLFDVFYKKGWELTWPWALLIMAATISVSALVIRARRRR